MNNLKRKLILLMVFVWTVQVVNCNAIFAANTNFVQNASSDLTVSKIYSGFKLESKKYIQDIDSTLYQFTHEKTGAKICYIKNNDDYKVFSLGFKTSANDNTGVNHVIEHVVSNQANTTGEGNAATTKTSTSYYFATSSQDEFQSNVKKTLNGAFSPKFSENLMKQEGWHYEISEPNDELKITGRVYNEMMGKDIFDTIIERDIPKSLFPDLNEFDAGGVSEDMPKITYKEFLETYKKYYIPSNSFIYLYGNLDISKTLKLMDDECFSKLNKVPAPAIQKDEKPCGKMNYSEVYYPLPKGSNTKDKTYLALNYVLGKEVDADTKKALDILHDILLSKESSPLIKSLSDNKIGSPLIVSSSSDVDINFQAPFTILILGNNESEKEKIETVVNNTLDNIVRNGLDKELVNLVINSYEMQSRISNSSVSRGRKYMGGVMAAWAQNKDSEKYLNTNSLIQNIREKMKKDNRYFENLIEKYLLNNPHSSLLVVKPKPGLLEENENKFKADLAKYKSSLSSNELNNLIDQTKEFKNWKDNQDNYKKEANKEESCDLSNVNKNSEEIPSEVKDYNGIKVLKHSIYTNDVEYLNFYFDTRKVPQDKLMYLMLLTKVLGQVDTKEYNHDKLSNTIETYTNGIHFKSYMPYSYINYKGSSEYYPKLQVSMSTLNDNVENSFNTLEKIINSSKFEDKNRLRSLIKQEKFNFESFNSDPYDITCSQSLSYNSDSNKYNNLSKIPFYNFICDLDKNFDKKSDEVIKGLDAVRNLTFDKENLVVSYTGDESNYDNFSKYFNSFTNKIKKINVPIQQYKFDYSRKNEGFIIPSKIQCIVKSGNYNKLGYTCSGKMRVLQMVLEGYLKREIREKNGAYTVGVDMDGLDILFYTNEDPNLKETIDIINNSASYLKNYNADKNQMARAILMAIGIMDIPRNPEGKGLYADTMYIQGITQKDKQKYRDEILSTTVEDIRNYAPMIEGLMKQNNLCVCGGKSKLNSEKSLFQSVKNLFDN